MQVYLVGKEGRRSAIKVTTSEIYSNIDSVLFQVLIMLDTRHKADKDYFGTRSILDILHYGYYTPKVYVTELDSKTGIKLITPKMWVKLLIDYIDRKGNIGNFKVLKNRRME